MLKWVNSRSAAVARHFERKLDPFADCPHPEGPLSLTGFCWHYLGDARGLLAAMAILNAIIALGEVLIFGFIGRLVDTLDGPGGAGGVDWPMLAGVGFALAIGLPAVNWLLSLVMWQSLFANLTMVARWRMHKRLSEQSISFFASEMSGRVVNRLMLSALSLRQAVWRLLEALARTVVYIAATAVVLSVADWRLLIPLAVWLGAYILILWWCIPIIRSASTAEAAARSTMTGRIVDSYSNILTLKLFARANAEDRYIREGMEEALHRNYAVMRGTTLLTGSVYLNNCLVVFSVGGLSLYLWNAGHISTGAVAVGTALAVRLNQVSQAIMWEVSGFFENLGMIIDGRSMLNKPLVGVDRPDARPLVVRRGGIEFVDVRFAYQPPREVISNLSLSVAPGERVGIVGRSGAGKSTLVNLLLRLYDVDHGSISIDGQDIGRATQKSVREAIAVVSQDTSLLNRSIRENIGLGRTGATDQEIMRAAQRAHAAEFIMQLEDFDGRRGLEAHVGERGVILSGGQRQRILLARIFLKDAPILVLDEATSALDSSAEAVIQEQLFDLMRGKTVLAIAHRLSTIAAMDRLVVLEGGRVTAEGRHETLIEEDGLYSELWGLQSDGFLGVRAKIAAAG